MWYKSVVLKCGTKVWYKSVVQKKVWYKKVWYKKAWYKWNRIYKFSKLRIKSTLEISYIHFLEKKTIFFFSYVLRFSDPFSRNFSKGSSIFASTISLKALKILKRKFPPRLSWWCWIWKSRFQSPNLKWRAHLEPKMEPFRIKLKISFLHQLYLSKRWRSWSEIFHFY